MCLSYAGTIKIVNYVSEDHDIEVQFWSDQLVDKIYVQVSHLLSAPLQSMHVDDLYVCMTVGKCGTATDRNTAIF